MRGEDDVERVYDSGMRAIDEDEVVEVVQFGGEVREIHVGLDHAEARARSRYVDGRLSVDEYEAEVDRLLRKRACS